MAFAAGVAVIRDLRRREAGELDPAGAVRRAHPLVSFDIERADATRLAFRYRQAGGVRTGMDIVQWLISTPFRRVVEWVRGDDRRRLDYDLEQKIQGMMHA